MNEDFNPAGNGGDLASSSNNAVGTGLTGVWTNVSTNLTDLGGNGAGVLKRTPDEAVSYPTNANLPAPAGGLIQDGANNYSVSAYAASLATPISLNTPGTYYTSFIVGDYAGGNPNYDTQLFFDTGSTRIYFGYGYTKSTSISVTSSTTSAFNAGASNTSSGGSYASGFNIPKWSNLD